MPWPDIESLKSNRFARQGLHVMSKPIGPICNLDCEYCYYLHKEELYPGATSWRMNGATLETYIRQYIEAQPAGVEEITFAWQGGEPTLLGVEFFRRAVAIQESVRPAKARIANALQTNGVLLDEEWAEFFHDSGFLIGLSIDGPADLHDHYRYDKQGRPTFSRVLSALQLLKRHEVEFNALVVVNRQNGDHGRRVYTYLRDNGVRFVQFIPIVERAGVGAHAETKSETRFLQETGFLATAGTPAEATAPQDAVSSRSVRPEQFGEFLIGVFDEWIQRDVGQVFVQIFDQALSAWMGLEPSLCVFRRQCGRALALEHNGDLYCCDHYVEPDFKLGNIHELPIVELANGRRQREFGAAKETTLPQYCRDCEVLFACNGECPKNRFTATPDGEEGLNYLCAGYRRFFNHIDPVMQLMVAELRSGRPAANVMHVLRERETDQSRKRSGRRRKDRSATAGAPQSTAPPGPNDACPCGSGRKFKKCCGTLRASM